ncbi:MAG: ABC transporter ATP-binding protein, partial [Chloroflexota bacterium]
MSTYEFEEEEFSTQFNGRTLLRILAQTRPHWKWLVGFLSAIACTAVIDSYFTFLGKRIIDEGIIPGNKSALVSIVITYGLLTVLQSCFVFTFIYLAGVLGERVRYDLRQKMFSHLQDLSLSYYSRTPVGWIMSRVTSDSDRVADLVTWGMLDITWAFMNISAASYFMLVINWRLALIILGILPILIVIAVQFRKKILVEFRMVRKINSRITGAYNENITGVRVVKALGREDENMREFSHLTSDMYRSGFRAAWLSALFLPAVQILSSVALGAIVLYGGLQAEYGGMTVGGIQAFIAYVTFMLW